jgi:hypothetical protein
VAKGREEKEKEARERARGKVVGVQWAAVAGIGLHLTLVAVERLATTVVVCVEFYVVEFQC